MNKKKTQNQTLIIKIMNNYNINNRYQQFRIHPLFKKIKNLQIMNLNKHKLLVPIYLLNHHYILIELNREEMINKDI